jgi:hypothetical protein
MVISLVIGSTVSRWCVLHFGSVRLRETFRALIEKGNKVQVGLNLSDRMVFSLCKPGPRSVSSATVISAYGYLHKKGQTIIFLARLVDNIVVIHISINFVIVEVKVDKVTHWHPGKIVAWRTGTPVFTQVGKHIDVIAQKVKDRLIE